MGETGGSITAVVVAQALVPAASALMPTLGRGASRQPRERVETSLDTAGTSARATSHGGSRHA